MAGARRFEALIVPGRPRETVLAGAAAGSPGRLP